MTEHEKVHVICENLCLEEGMTKEQINELVDSENSETKSELKNEINIERQRINNIASLEQGSTTGDAELIDIRTGFDGTTYSNAGNAVRGQASALNTMFNNIAKIDTLEWSSGYINYDDGIEQNALWKHTNYIQVRNDNGIVAPLYIDVKTNKNVLMFAYTKDKKLVERIKLTESNSEVAVQTLLFNKDYAYVRLNSVNSYAAKVYYSKLNDMAFSNYSITNDVLQDESVTKYKTDFIHHNEDTNFINFDTISTHKYVKSNGLLNNDNSLNATDFIRLKENETYYTNGVQATYYAFYNERKEFMVGYTTLGNITNNQFTIPEGAWYGRFTIHNNSLEGAWISTKNEKPKAYEDVLDSNVKLHRNFIDLENPCDFTGTDIQAFKNCLCVGDSLTAGVFNKVGGSVTKPEYSYPTNLQKMTGIEVTNKGVGGYTSVDWYNHFQNDDLSGYNMAIIQLGVNDYYKIDHDWTNASKTAFTNIINKLKSENNNIKIFVATIIPARSYPASDFANISQGIRDLVEELDDDNVILLDIAKYGHTAPERAYNCGHLSAYGYWRLAKDYMAYISYVMVNNPMLFREIQFIGTNDTSGY